MAAFLEEHAEQAQDSLYAREVPPRVIGACPSCCQPLDDEEGHKATLYNCQDCILLEPMCRVCILSAHRYRPLDHIRQWSHDEGCWVKVPLKTLGHKMYLGHGAKTCPRIPTREDGNPILHYRVRPMVIIHEHGIVDADVVFCECEPRRSAAAQLITSGLWPATWDYPKTATTLSALEVLDALTLEADVTIHDYGKYLKRMTDGVMTDEVPVSSACSGPSQNVTDPNRIATAS